MAALLRTSRPRIVVAAHPLALWMASHALAELRRQGAAEPRPLLWALVTDLVSIHHAWLQPGVDRYIAGCIEGAAVLRARGGLPTHAVIACGLPIDGSFAAVGRTRQAPAALHTVLVAGGGDGAGSLVEVAQAIAGSRLVPRVIAVCGRNHRAYQRLHEASQRLPGLAVHGYVDDMAARVAQADVLVTKAGSVTLAEAAAAACPMVISMALPGQEADNRALLTHYGAGIVAEGTAATLCALRALRDDPARLSALADGCRRLARPYAAQIVAQAILDQLDLGPAPLAPAVAAAGLSFLVAAGERR
jgi:processive 1,2-diacylglycerol beta-glucosyltransferase